MVERGLVLMVPAPMGPIQDEKCMRGRWPHETSKQMTHFSNGEANQGLQVDTSRLLVPNRSAGMLAHLGLMAQRGGIGLPGCVPLLTRMQACRREGRTLCLRLDNRGSRAAIRPVFLLGTDPS